MKEQAGSKLRRIIYDTKDVIPVPDFAIIHRHKDLVMVQCLTEKRPFEVIHFLRTTEGGNWSVTKWLNVVNNEYVEQQNPHKNNFDMWVWLMKKS